MESDEPSTSGIRSYAFRKNNSSVNTTTAHPNASNVIPDEDESPCNMSFATNSPYPCIPNTSEHTESEICTLLDLETRQLRDMFPNCPENVLIAASERCGTVDSAVNVVKILADQASM